MFKKFFVMSLGLVLVVGLVAVGLATKPATLPTREEIKHFTPAQIENLKAEQRTQGPVFAFAPEGVISKTHTPPTTAGPQPELYCWFNAPDIYMGIGCNADCEVNQGFPEVPAGSWFVDGWWMISHSLNNAPPSLFKIKRLLGLGMDPTGSALLWESMIDPVPPYYEDVYYDIPDGEEPMVNGGDPLAFGWEEITTTYYPGLDYQGVCSWIWVKLYGGPWGSGTSYGISGDYNFTLVLKVGIIPEDDMGVTAILEPPAKVSADFAPVVEVKNYGTETQDNVDVRVTIDDGAGEVYNEVVQTGSLDEGDSETLTFPVFSISPGGSYDIEACTELVDDETPENDCKSSETMVCDYLNDFEVAGCFTPYGSWAWGEPTSGPGGALSGTKCWATNLTGNYPNNACDSLIASFLAIADDPILMYAHWYSIENAWDGYAVYMSVDGGAWELAPADPPYTRSSCYAGCWVCDDWHYTASSGGWKDVTLDLSGVVTGEKVDIMWLLGTDASVQYPGVYIDDICAARMELAPPNVDLDVDDDYANLVANKMTLVATKSKKTVMSYTYGDFVVLNADEDLNVDYWDGPGDVGFDEILYEASDLYNYHDKEGIPGGNVTCYPPKTTLKNGEAMLVLLEVAIPTKHMKHIKHDEEKHVYRGSVTVTGNALGECGSGTSSDEFTLNVKIVKGKAGTLLPNSFVGDWDDKALTLSWGNFNFAESHNLYRANGSGEFIKLNSTPMPGNSNYIDENVVEGETYEYKFGVILESGEEMVFGPMTAVLTRRPAHASLMPCEPNPMNTETVIRYALANDAEVSLKIYDVSGSLVKTLVNEPVPAGYHSAVWNGTNEANEKVANGVYFYRLTAGDFTKSLKLVILK